MSIDPSSPSLPPPNVGIQSTSTSTSEQSTSVANLDLSLSTSISYLSQFLIQPLSSHYPHHILLSLRAELSNRLTTLFSSTWDTSRPQFGSGYRSLICSRHLGLPLSLVEAAKAVGVERGVWKRAIAGIKSGERGEEWQCWCDPGQVTWRWGGWEWEDVGYEPWKVIKEPFQIIWQSSSSLSPSISTSTPNAPTHTPARASHAIPIRAPIAVGPPTPGPGPTAPALYAIPPTPSQHPARTVHETDNLLPAFSTLGLGHPSGLGGNRDHTPSGWTSSTGTQSRETSYGDRSIDSYQADSDDEENHEHDRSKAPSRGSHRGSESTSSITSSSSVSDSNSGHTQLLTPSSRPNSADPFLIPSLSLKDKERSRKITPPSQTHTRGRTPSPNSTDSMKENLTPATDTTLTPSTPTVTPYDGGNVTVLGGGVKLGGASRPGSVISSHRSPIDRSRSPSISLASRALGSATTEGGSTRKQRTRRRIMPTYLGHLGQPGVGGPVMGAFQSFTPTKTGTGSSVGVGVSPPPVNVGGGRSVSLPTTMPRMG
ncbi:hypothetical protein I302_101259 [Kwoniella bestiolae CBS 10118]|uniref:Anti-proliferative protein domain-containing protein n=1 Tax=Kwoniella bestiolae CBS 10118 TaxID=1296100 RepID=A0A1B9G7F4_9TREE|nr:hypothetical protein I302_04633 [Kwoniella bestiolae CBS 10118]OCF26942.1 hypothetical protein I302_04633 [Kwoniella bestiolae CBS 10118]